MCHNDIIIYVIRTKYIVMYNKVMIVFNTNIKSVSISLFDEGDQS